MREALCLGVKDVLLSAFKQDHAISFPSPLTFALFLSPPFFFVSSAYTRYLTFTVLPSACHSSDKRVSIFVDFLHMVVTCVLYGRIGNREKWVKKKDSAGFPIRALAIFLFTHILYL